MNSQFAEIPDSKVIFQNKHQTFLIKNFKLDDEIRTEEVSIDPQKSIKNSEPGEFDPISFDINLAEFPVAYLPTRSPQ